jgi:hypothetical protein
MTRLSHDSRDAHNHQENEKGAEVADLSAASYAIQVGHAETGCCGCGVKKP